MSSDLLAPDSVSGEPFWLLGGNTVMELPATTFKYRTQTTRFAELIVVKAAAAHVKHLLYHAARSGGRSGQTVPAQ